MDAYANVLLIAIPFFFGLIFLEWAVSRWKNKKVYRSMDTISSLSSGMTNTLKSVLGLIVIIVSYAWVEERIALFDIQTTWLVWILSFLAIDFAQYWTHRLSHSINFFWNKHVIHHSSEEFNLACALRQTISNIVSLGFIFLLPAAFLGLPPEIIAVIAPIHLFLQFWYHTTLIGKMGWLEYIIVTPSQHRVHHAINDEYLDKNLSAIFCIWDRLFGTFQEELDEVPCIYGVKRAVATWNPIKINLHHFGLLAQDAWRAEKWTDKLKLWFMPTGWRPSDVAKKYPVEYTKDAFTQVKFAPKISKNIEIWSWIQFVLANVFITQLLLLISELPVFQLFIYGGFIFLLIYSYTTLMDGDQNAIWFELLKSTYGFGVIFYFNDWFLLNQFWTGGVFLVATYLLISVLLVGYFVRFEQNPKSEHLIISD